MKVIIGIVISAAICVFSTNAMAQLKEIGSIDTPDGKKGDPRVSEALKSASVKYTVDSDGDFKVVWSLADSRDHVVFINSRTSKYASSENVKPVELREIWAVAFVAGDISKGNLMALLELNSSYKLGSWGLSKQGDGRYMARFIIRVPAECRGAILRQFTSLVAEAADEIEKRTTGKDEY